MQKEVQAAFQSATIHNQYDDKIAYLIKIILSKFAYVIRNDYFCICK